jgi:hypothetical protein
VPSDVFDVMFGVEIHGVIIKIYLRNEFIFLFVDEVSIKKKNDGNFASCA